MLSHVGAAVAESPSHAAELTTRSSARRTCRVTESVDVAVSVRMGTPPRAGSLLVQAEHEGVELVTGREAELPGEHDVALDVSTQIHELYGETRTWDFS